MFIINKNVTLRSFRATGDYPLRPGLLPEALAKGKGTFGSRTLRLASLAQDRPFSPFKTFSPSYYERSE